MTRIFFSLLFWRQPLLGNPLGKHLSQPCPWGLSLGPGYRWSRGSGACLQATETNISWHATQRGICWKGVGQSTDRWQAEDPGLRGAAMQNWGAAVNVWPLPGAAPAGRWGRAPRLAVPASPRTMLEWDIPKAKRGCYCRSGGMGAGRQMHVCPLHVPGRGGSQEFSSI